MGVIITGMEMPEGCFDCRFNRWRFGWSSDNSICTVMGRDVKINPDTGFDDDCPLKPIDRLVEQIDGIVGHIHDSNYWNGVYDAIEIIKNYCKEKEKP